MSVLYTELSGLPIDEHDLFSDHDSVFSEKLKKQRLTLLTKINKFLKRFIKAGEKVIMISRAHSPMTFGELYFSGYFVYFQKRCVLVFTDQRILRISLNLSGKVRDTIVEIDYGNIETIKRGGVFNPTLIIKFKNGKQDSYTYFNAGDLKKIIAILPKYLDRPATRTQYQYHLCLRCTNPLEANNYFCPHCRFEYKDPQQMLRYALIFPGGGFFYTGQYLFAVQYLLVEGLLLAFFIYALIESINTNALWEGVIGTFILLIFTKIIHIFHGRRRIKEYIPKQTVLGNR